MEHKCSTRTKFQQTNLDECGTMSSFLTESPQKSSDSLETAIDNVEQRNEFQNKVKKDKLQTINESLKPTIITNHSVDVKVTKLTEIDRTTKHFDTWKDNPVIAMSDSDDTPSASQLVDSSTHLDSGFCGHMSTVNESVLGGTSGTNSCDITTESVVKKCKLLVSPSSYAESWDIGIQTTSTPCTKPEIHSDEQNMCRVSIDVMSVENITYRKKSAKTLRFENEPQDGNREINSKPTNESGNSGNNFCSCQSLGKENCKKIDIKMIGGQQTLSCSSDLIMFTPVENISETRLNAGPTLRLMNHTYCLKSDEELKDPETIEGLQSPECLSKVVKSPTPEKVSQTRTKKNPRGVTRPGVLTSEGRRRSGRFVSMAEAMCRFITETPKRFHTKPLYSGQLLPQWRNRVFEHNSSRGKFLHSTRKIKGKKLGSKPEESDSAGPSCSGTTKESAGPVPISDSFQERNERLLSKRKANVKKSDESYVFRARPMPKFKTPKIKKSVKPLTNPQTPSWGRKK
ncbi:uncharacterized protein [Venturia canescens]|uniref:uncharacterized protein n=1 Tax=Venturia canescens TaxID=32260 RepID=UPI001C9C05FF|nr:uncharacterized protein LOC122408353 [Venturia canescens]